MAAMPLANAWPLTPPSSAARAVFEAVAGWVARARVVPALVRAYAGEFKGGGKIEGDIHSAGEWVRVLPGVHGKG